MTDLPVFINDQIENENLPQVEQVNYLPVERDYLKVVLISCGVFGFIMLAIFVTLLFTHPDDTPSWFLPGLAAFFIGVFALTIVASYKSYNYMGYAIRNRDILFKKGWLWKSNTMIPFNRVQHCEVNQNPIERYFGLAKLKVFTAGGTSSDLSISGLTPAKAEQLKHYITTQTAHDQEE